MPATYYGRPQRRAHRAKETFCPFAEPVVLEGARRTAHEDRPRPLDQACIVIDGTLTYIENLIIRCQTGRLHLSPPTIKLDSNVDRQFEGLRVVVQELLRPRQQLLFPIDVEVAVVPPQGLEEEESYDAGEKNLVGPAVGYQRIDRLDSVGDLRASKDGDVRPLLYRKDSLQTSQLLGDDTPRTRRQDVGETNDGGGEAAGGRESVEDACVEVPL